MRLLRLMATGSGCLALAACAPATPVATAHCAGVIAQRPEASLTYPGARVIDRSAHEGSANIDAGEPGGPWAAQTMAVPATEQATRDWYTTWLGSHGWSHTKDQPTTDATGVKTADVSSWSRGNEFFQVSVVLSDSARQRDSVAAADLLVTTQYLAAPSVLGCT